MVVSQVWQRFFVVLIVGLLTVSPCCSQQSAPPRSLILEGPYLVVSLVESTSPFYLAAELLAERHEAEIIQVEPSALESILEELQNRQPAYVAFVVNPADLDINLVNRLVALSTQVDADPFVDFSWGVITGRDGAAAEKLVKASERLQSDNAPSIAMFGVGGASLRRSTSAESSWPLRSGSIPVTNYTAKGETDEDRDAAFIVKTVPKLGQSPIVLLASHGYPDGLVAGPKATDLKEADLAGCVLLNIACYTGVTGVWYDYDYQTMKVRRHSVDPANSFCLQAIDCGVAGYFAYTSPRPAGPTMMGDALLIAASGQALGDLFRESQQSIVLAHLLSGEDRLKLEPLVEGAPIEPNKTRGEIVRQFSTGGILFGDPAFRPFPAKPDSDARRVEVQEQADRIVVEMNIQSPIFHFFAGDQINYWEESSSALRLECAVPLKDRVVEQIQIVSVPDGITDYRWVAAAEQVSDQRFLRFKLNFAQPQDMTKLQQLAVKGLAAKIEILTSSEPDSGDSIYRGKNE